MFGRQDKKFLFDSGNSNGLVLSIKHIEEFGLNINNLGSIVISSPGATDIRQYVCLVNINEIKVGEKNILEKPMEEKIPLIFSSNPKQTPIIGQTPFMDYVCCINYKDEEFSIDKPQHR